MKVLQRGVFPLLIISSATLPDCLLARNIRGNNNNNNNVPPTTGDDLDLEKEERGELERGLGRKKAAKKGKAAADFTPPIQKPQPAAAPSDSTTTNDDFKWTKTGLGFGPIQNNLGFGVKGSGFSSSQAKPSPSTQPPPPATTTTTTTTTPAPPTSQADRPEIIISSGGLYGARIGEPYVPKPRASEVTIETNTVGQIFGPNFSKKDGPDTHRYEPPSLHSHGVGTGFQQKLEAEEAGFTLELNAGFNAIEGSVSAGGKNHEHEPLRTYFIKLNKTADEDAENITSTLIRKHCNGQRKSRTKQLLQDYLILDANCAPEELSQSDLVDTVEEDDDVYPDFDTCNAPFATGDDYAWGIDRVDQVFGVNNDFGLPYAGENVDVYIIDSGVDEMHEQFMDDNGQTRVKAYFDCVKVDLGDPCIPVPFPAQRTLCDGESGSDHGTHVAGSCCGKTTGIAPKANIYAFRVFTCKGSAKLHYIINALDHIKERCIAEGSNRCVINMSLGTGVKKSLNDAVQAAIDAGIVVIASAGNNYGRDSCTKSPSSVSSVITVAASDINDEIPDFVNKGDCIDIIAPGAAVYSAAGIGGYELMWGTSMAAPHVAGAAAIFLSEKHQASPQVVTNALTLTYPRMSIQDTRDKKESFSYPLLHMPCGCGDDGNHTHVCTDGPSPPPGSCFVSNCTSCELDDAQSCVLCEPGFGLDGDDGCSKCPDNCQSCSTNSDVCDQCIEGFGPLSDSTECAPCGTGCVNCETDQAVCSQCEEGLGRDPANKEVCKPCAEGCDGCSNMNYEGCITCLPGFGFATSTNVCSPCLSSQCADCSINHNSCSECKEGQMLVGDMCISLQINVCGEGDIQIEVYTDWYPGDVVFEFIDPDGEVLLTSLPLDAEWTTYRYNLTRYNSVLTNTNCNWKFRMQDKWGDGLFAPAYYAIYSGERLLHRGGGDHTSYTSIEETMF